MLKKKFYQQRGFSFIQLMIAASVMGAISLGLTQMISNMYSQVSYIEDKESYLSFKKELTKTLEEKISNCSASLSGVRLSSSAPINITINDDLGNVLYDPADPTKNKFENLKIDSIQVQDIDVISGAGTSGDVNFLINTSRIRKGGGPTQLRPIELVQRVTVDTSSGNEITGCNGSGVGGIPVCLHQDFNNYGTRSSSFGPATGSYRLPANIKAIKLSMPARTSRRPQTTCNGNDRSRDDCEIPGFDMVIYPGVTEYSGRVLPAGQVLRVETVPGVSYDSCDNGRTSTNTNYYYGGRLIYSYRGKTSRNGCPTNYFPQASLLANALPPLCPNANARAISSFPDNLGFLLYREEPY